MQNEWQSKDREYESSLKDCIEGSENMIVAIRIIACDSIEELEHVKKTYLNLKDTSQKYNYRKQKIHLRIKSVNSFETWPSLLKYVQDCISEATSATEKGEYRDLWNETLAEYARASIDKANVLRFSSFGKSY